MKHKDQKTIHQILEDEAVDFAIVKAFIDAHPECIHTIESDNSVLDIAVLYGRLDVVELLIAKGVDVNKADNYGVTSLYEAIHSNHLSIARVLLQSGADVNLKDRDGWNAFHFAISSESQVMLELILEQNMDAKVTTRQGEDLLTFAKKYGTREIAIWLDGALAAQEEALILRSALKGTVEPALAPTQKSSAMLRL